MQKQSKEAVSFPLNYRLFELEETFKQKSNFVKNNKENFDFYNGKQYADDNVSNTLRLQLNLIGYGIDVIASKLNGTPVYLSYTCDKENLSNKIGRFDEYQLKRIHNNTFRYQACKNGCISGTEITFLRWDADNTTYKGIYKGGLVQEHIDPKNFFVANDFCNNIQNQSYCGYRVYTQMSAIENMIECDTKEEEEYIKSLLSPDNADDLENEERETYLNQGYAWVYVRYFRVNGEVYFTASTRTTNLWKYPRAMNPKISNEKLKDLYDKYEKEFTNSMLDTNKSYQPKIIDLDIDWENELLQTKNLTLLSDEEYAQIKDRFSLYPFAIFEPKPIKESFYGNSSVRALIPNQKIVNFAITAYGKYVELCAFPKMRVKNDALGGQVITGKIGEMIYDRSKTNGWGIDWMQPPSMNNNVFDFINTIIQNTAKFNSFSDVLGGNISNQDISGYAYQLALKQNNTSLEQTQNILWDYEIDKAQIRLLFYKFYVKEDMFVYEISDSEKARQENSLQTLKGRISNGTSKLANENPQLADEIMQTKEVNKVKFDTLSSDEIKNVAFDISIDATQGLQESELAESQVWDNLLINGGLQNIDPQVLKIWATANRKIPDHQRKELLSVFDEVENSQITQLKELVAKQQQVIEQAKAGIKQLTNQARLQNEYNKELTNQFGKELNATNKKIMASPNQMSDGEAKSRNSKGISGSDIVEDEMRIT